MTTSIHHEAEAAGSTGAIGRAAERAAFAELYERQFPDLYDFAVRTLGDTEGASEVVATAFLQTVMGFRQRRTSAPVDAILFATARNVALDNLRKKAGAADPAIQALLQSRFVAVDESRASGPNGAPDSDLAELVWRLLSAHAPEEYSLLDLLVRRGIPVTALAAAMGRPAEELRLTLAGTQSNVEEWITTVLLTNRGRKECAGLNAVLEQVGPNAPSEELRTAVQRHLGGCEVCPQLRKRYPTAAETFAALALVPAPDGVREAIRLDVLGSVEPRGRAAAAAPAPRGEKVFGALDAPVRWWNGATTRQKAIAAGVAALGTALFVAVAILLAPSSSIGVEDPQGFASATHEIGEPSTQEVVAITWEANPEASGYSVEWSQEDDTLPDEIADLDGDATETKSPELTAGEWYFHLRTQGAEGRWTRTVHLGPFVIAATDDNDDSGATPTPRATASPTPELEPEPEPEPTPTPDPVATETPQPTATPAPVSACPPLESPEAASPTAAMGPVQTVRQYYLLINEARYEEAYGLLGADLQAAFAPFSDWAAGFATTTIVNPLTTVMVEEGAGYAVVYVEVTAEDSGVPQLFKGTWLLTSDGGPWKMAQANVGVMVC